MKKVQSQLKTVAKQLSSLADKLEKINAQLESAPPAAKTKAAAPKKRVAKPAPAKTKAAAAKEAPVAKDSVLNKVYEVIRKSRNGATIANLKAKTELESRQLSNALYKLSKKGKIKAKSRGVYVKA
jgi:predicted Rossmann fold nucleotide-binding protein DprA/Smf involved in DNA uptake